MLGLEFLEKQFTLWLNTKNVLKVFNFDTFLGNFAFVHFALLTQYGTSIIMMTYFTHKCKFKWKKKKIRTGFRFKKKKVKVHKNCIVWRYIEDCSISKCRDAALAGKLM